MKKQRQSNLELLRIISMLMIVSMHLVNHGGLIDLAQAGTLSYYFVWTLFGVSFISINLYLLISGYFLVDTKFSSWKLARLGGQVFFYAFGITMLFWLFGKAPKDLETFVRSVLPVGSDFYWFISMYVGMYLLAPVMNRLIRALTKRQMECAMALSFVLVSVWPNILYFSSALNTAGGVSISWFLTVYLFGAYLKLYYRPDGKFAKKMLPAVGVSLLIPFSRFVIELLLQTPLGKIAVLDDLMWGYSIFYNYSSILAGAAAFLWFLAFLNLRVAPGRLSRGIVAVAKTAFGVYLIHDHLYIRESLWGRMGCVSWLGKWYLPFAVVGAVFFVYAACALIEALRQLLFAPLDRNRKLKGFFERLDKRLYKIWKEEKR